MTKVKKKISFAEEKIYVGIDVHKTQWTICVCTEHANFRPFVIALPDEFSKSKWTQGMRNWLWNLELQTQEGTKTIRLNMGRLEYIRGMCVNTDNHLRALSRTDRWKKQIDILMKVAGFGRLRAIEFLVELGDIKRFKNLDQLSNYAGLIPSSNNSGNRLSQGELTTRGHKQLRTMLIEAAWISINTDPAMAQKYGKLKKRMLAQQAIVSIARKLLNRVRYVLVNEAVYQKGIEA